MGTSLFKEVRKALQININMACSLKKNVLHNLQA